MWIGDSGRLRENRPDRPGQALPDGDDGNRDAAAAIEPAGDIAHQRREHGAIAKNADEQEMQGQKFDRTLAVTY